MRTVATDTNTRGIGFIAPFVYVKLVLVDAQTMAVIGEKTAEESTVRSTGRNPASLDPWDAATPEQKVAMLKALLNKAMASALPGLLAKK